MTNLHIESFNENGIQKWGIFYDDDKGIHRTLTENFKALVYESIDNAQIRLDAMEMERKREDEAQAFSVEEAKVFAEEHKWKYATTYAKTAPHEYLVKEWLSESDKQLFERFVQTINKHAVTGYFYEHENNYLILDEYYYWYMPCYPNNMAVDLINRTTTDYLEYRDGAYHYKPKNIGEENIYEPDRL